MHFDEVYRTEKENIISLIFDRERDEIKQN
jgi:hypothetical protein